MTEEELATQRTALKELDRIEATLATLQSRVEVTRLVSGQDWNDIVRLGEVVEQLEATESYWRGRAQ